MVSNDTLISIIIPTYNRGDIVKQTLQSVANQTYENWECIIVDDGSNDNSNKVIEEFSLADERFKFIKRERSPKGAPTCRNIGFEICKGEFIIFLDSDDLLGTNCLEQRLDFTEKNPGLDLYCFPTAIFNEKPGDTDKVWNYLHKPSGDLQRFFMQDMPWCVYGSFWQRNFLTELGGWDENLICGQDWDMHVRALLKKGIRYLKAGDERKNIDSFYRINNSYVSINNKENDAMHIKNRMYLFNKFLPALGQLDEGVRLEYARLIFRLSKQAVPQIGFSAPKQFFVEALGAAELPKLFVFLWTGYLHNLCDQKQNKGFKRIYNLAYRLYKSKNLLVYNSTHLIAVYEK